ncbi:2,3-diaminopropionate biosynthesis protein SbnA [Bacillus arachidis]|uniref:2,3-diaminopropionate biosynthesis protein SbnA n=1 Tax=Bacillus arachidis TaxID=2819290 RepID=UPI00255CE7A6|nr:2,3-diaminopropionate biosynthesis protein SbnA [Bacillus arachidis]WIY62271.1 2,3-diaminopropionate biosynthesis protein SbnA [Bacillus arachidis]
MSIYNSVLDFVGKTPMVQLTSKDLCNVNLFVKLEGNNPTGSVKDRAAAHILETLLQKGDIDKDTTIIESSSGNFGIALASYCKRVGLKFICVVDPKILPVNEMIIRSLGATVIKVTEPDNSGGYLITRLEKVNELRNSIANSYWINQYGNKLVANAYYETVGKQICNEIEVDYIFLGVSSGGTITGISNCVKEKFPKSKVIAVDMEGSVIFGLQPQNRSIPGIGSSIVPDILKDSIIDDVVIISEKTSIEMCKELLSEHAIFAGGSSGAVYGAVKNYFKDKNYVKKPNVVTLFADRGDRYFDTIYNEEWCHKVLNLHSEKELSLI